MPCKITVIARVDEAGTWLARLVDSLDAQDLPYDEFEVVFLVPDPGSGVGQRLAELSRRRPNVRVAALTGDPAAPDHDLRGEWVLDLGPELRTRQPVLFPQALSRLVDFGTSQDCQAVLGRAVATTGGAVDELYVTDRPRLDGGGTSLAGPGPVTVLRRDLALTHSPDGTPDVTRSLAAAQNVGVLASYPSLLITPPRQPADGAAVRLDKPDAQWRHGRVEVCVTGSAQDCSSGAALFGIRQKGSGLEYWLPVSTTSWTEGTFCATTEIDVRTAALGAPLGEGVWTITVGVRAGAIGPYVCSPLPPGSLVSGVIDGILVVPTTAGAQFALDVGATRSGVVPRPSAADVDIAESARGTLMTVRLGSVAVAGDARIPGSLHLDKLQLPAYLVAEDGRARIECFVSGLAGTAALSTQFGSGQPKATGLNLLISPTGIMTVVPAPDKPASAPAPAGSSARQADRPAGASVAVRLRRSVPAPLEPAVRSLARNKVAARAYRRLMTGRAAQR